MASVPAQHCFVSLPTRLLQPLASVSTLPLRLRWLHRGADGPSAAREAYVAWGGGASASDAIEVPAALIEALGMALPVRVTIDAISVPTAERVGVRAETAADWALIEAEAVSLEVEVLSQTNVVGSGQLLPLWCSQTRCAWLRVIALTPSAPVLRLGLGTELDVEPPPAPPAPAPAARRVGRSVRARVARADIGALCICAAADVLQACGCAPGVWMRVCVGDEGAARRGGGQGKGGGGGGGDAGGRGSRAGEVDAPGVGFGVAVPLCGAQSPAAGHVALSRFLRLQLGVELGATVCLRRADVTPTATHPAQPEQGAAAACAAPSWAEAIVITPTEMTAASAADVWREDRADWLDEARRHVDDAGCARAASVSASGVPLADGALLRLPCGLAALSFERTPPAGAAPPTLSTRPHVLSAARARSLDSRGDLVVARPARLRVRPCGGDARLSALMPLCADADADADAPGVHEAETDALRRHVAGVLRYVGAGRASCSGVLTHGALFGALLHGPSGSGRTHAAVRAALGAARADAADPPVWAARLPLGEMRHVAAPLALGRLAAALRCAPLHAWHTRHVSRTGARAQVRVHVRAGGSRPRRPRSTPAG